MKKKYNFLYIILSFFAILLIAEIIYKICSNFNIKEDFDYSAAYSTVSSKSKEEAKEKKKEKKNKDKLKNSESVQSKLNQRSGKSGKMKQMDLMDKTNEILHSFLSPSEKKKEFEKLKSEIEEETGKVIKINLGDQSQDDEINEYLLYLENIETNYLRNQKNKLDQIEKNNRKINLHNGKIATKAIINKNLAPTLKAQTKSAEQIKKMQEEILAVHPKRKQYQNCSSTKIVRNPPSYIPTCPYSFWDGTSNNKNNSPIVVDKPFTRVHWDPSPIEASYHNNLNTLKSRASN